MADGTIYRGLGRFVFLMGVLIVVTGMVDLAVDGPDAGPVPWVLIGVGLSGAAAGAAIRFLAGFAPDPFRVPADPSERFEVRVRLDAAVVREVNRRLVRRAASWGGGLLVLGLLALLASSLARGDPTLLVSGIVLSVVGFVLLIFPFTSWLESRAAFALVEGLGAEQTLTFSPAGYERRAPGPAALTFQASWDAFRRLDESERAFVLRSRFFLPQYVLIVPKAAFKDEAQQEWFRARVIERWRPRPKAAPTFRSAGAR